MEESKKYKIEEKLNGMTVVKYKAAMRMLPQQLKISPNTLHNYRKMCLGAKTDIPYEIVRKLEILLGMQQGELANYELETVSLETLLIAEKRSNA